MYQNATLMISPWLAGDAARPNVDRRNLDLGPVSTFSSVHHLHHTHQQHIFSSFASDSARFSTPPLLHPSPVRRCTMAAKGPVEGSSIGFDFSNYARNEFLGQRLNGLPKGGWLGG